MKSVNPSTGKLIIKHKVLSEPVLIEKIELSHVSYESYRKTDFFQRSILLKKVAELLINKSTEYA